MIREVAKRNSYPRDKTRQRKPMQSCQQPETISSGCVCVCVHMRLHPAIPPQQDRPRTRACTCCHSLTKGSAARMHVYSEYPVTILDRLLGHIRSPHLNRITSATRLQVL